MNTEKIKCCDLNNRKLELDYPCDWKYKVIIRHEQDIQPIIKGLLKGRKYNIKPSKQSSKGKFTSHSLEMEVDSDEDRKKIYKLLNEHQHIKMIV